MKLIGAIQVWQKGNKFQTDKSQLELIEMVRLAQIIPIVYWYQGMYTICKTDQVGFCPSISMKKLIPVQYRNQIDFNKQIRQMKQYNGFLENILSATTGYTSGNINAYLYKKCDLVVRYNDPKTNDLLKEVEELKKDSSTIGDLKTKFFGSEEDKINKKIAEDKLERCQSELYNIVCDQKVAIRDYDVAILVSFITNLCQHDLMATYKLDEYFQRGNYFSRIIDYKPLIDKYSKLEDLLQGSEKILDYLMDISPNKENLSEISLVSESLKSSNRALLLLTRFVFFDVPLSCDSLYTCMKIKKYKGAFDDDEEGILRSVQKYATLSPIISNYTISSYVNELQQTIYTMAKKELGENVAEELKQRALTQPAWLKKPTM